MKKVLAIKNRRLGDTALWTSSLEALRDFTGNPIDVAYPAAYSALFESDPRINYQFFFKADRSSQWDILKKVRRMNYDAVLNFHANNQTALLTRFSGGKKLLIHHHSRTARSSKHSISIPNVGIPMSAIERDLNVVRGLGWSGESPAPKLVVGPSLKTKGEELLNPHLKTNLKKLVLSVSASRLSKQWPIENFITLAQLLRDRYQIFVLYDSPLKSDLWTALKEVTHSVHTPDLPSLLGCLVWMDGFIGADSGVKHIAAALGLPTVTLFGPESIGEWHGYPLDKHKALQVPVACRDQNLETPEYAWCGHEICPLASHACMSQISPKIVAQEIISLM